MAKKIVQLVKPILELGLGVGSFIPGFNRLNIMKWIGTGGTDSARYCYSIWLRHLVLAHKNSPHFSIQNIAELGPGDSLGMGLAALISGANHYYAFDVVEFGDSPKNVAILNKLIELFKKREPIPGPDEFPQVKPYLESYDFPDYILTEEKLEQCLNTKRLESIREALLNLNKTSAKFSIVYKVPWDNESVIEENSMDMIISQATLEHVDDLETTYRTLYRFLKPGGIMSHQIDFRSHGTAFNWDRHWLYSDFIWGLIRGKRGYLLNRQPYSVHLDLLNKFEFKICEQKLVQSASTISKRLRESYLRHFSAEDFSTSGAFIQALKL